MITYYNPLGGVSLTNEYFAGLVGEAAQHCYGVAGMASSSASDSIKSLILGKNRADKGVRVSQVDGKLAAHHGGLRPEHLQHCAEHFPPCAQRGGNRHGPEGGPRGRLRGRCDRRLNPGARAAAPVPGSADRPRLCGRLLFEV